MNLACDGVSLYLWENPFPSKKVHSQIYGPLHPTHRAPSMIIDCGSLI